MAYNDKKILEVLITELAEVPEEYEGYREDLVHLLAEVLTIEREHKIARTNVVQKISDQINTVGMELYKARTN